MRKEAVIGGAFVAAAGIVAVVIYALSPVAGATTSSTLHLFEHDTQQASLDLGGKGTNPGNLFVYAGDVFDHATRADCGESPRRPPPSRGASTVGAASRKAS